MKTKKILLGGAIAGATIGVGTALYYKNRKTIPDGVEAVTPFDVRKYEGKWHEVARLDSLFQKRLDNVASNHILDDDGNIKVIYSGYNYKESRKEQMMGTAKFVGEPNEAKMKISFGGPSTGYNVIALDKDYKHAMVAGRNLNHLWLLSRETSLPDNVKESYLEQAKKLGFPTENLIWSEH